MQDRFYKILNRYEELNARLSNPQILSDNESYTECLKEISELRETAEVVAELKKAEEDLESVKEMTADPELKDMAREEYVALEEKISSLEERIKILLLPKDPNDSKNVIMEIRGGVGGEEGMLFAADLYRMYSMYAEVKGFKTDIANINETELGGIKEISFVVEGQGAYSRLKYEAGTHRVQRVPVTESGGRIHTSTITVAVIPEVDDDIVIDIPDKDVRIDVMRASGNGGQCVNTTDSAVRLTHYPTGIVIYSQTEKSQLQNKAKAWALLRAKLYDLESQKRHDEEADLRRSQIGTGDRSEKIRTYNFPQGRVTDHRIRLTLYKIDAVMNGDLDEILDSLTAADQAAKLARVESEKPL